jgi:hypothetical protein
MLREDPAAWDLAWLSWDFESDRLPDMHFSVNIRRTLQFVIRDGGLDMTGDLPDHLKVRGLMKYTAPRAVKLILDMPNAHKTHMFLAYGTDWLQTLQARSHLYRAPYDKAYDFDVEDLTQATEVIAKTR